MRYQVGDRVIVREDLAPHTQYHMENSINADTVVEDMFDFLGKVVTIEDVSETCYAIKENEWNWTECSPVSQRSLATFPLTFPRSYKQR